MNSEVNNFKQRLLQSLPLIITTIVCIMVVTGVYHLTHEEISANKQKAALKIINEVMPVAHDNNVFADRIEVTVPAFINQSNSVSVYRARRNNQAVAASLMPVIARGYNGDIQIVIGISYDGRLTGVRVIRHQETEGLGDNIHQNKSDWLKAFNGHSLETTAEKQWAVKKDGGDFDQLSGATITPRSVINTVYKTLEYYSKNREQFYK